MKRAALRLVRLVPLLLLAALALTGDGQAGAAFVIASTVLAAGVVVGG